MASDAVTRARRRSRRLTWLALLLWMAFAAVVWNVVFDRLLVLAGRRYSYAAAVAASARRPPVLVGPWMAEAQRRAVRTSTLIAAPIAVVGAAAVALATLRHPRSGG